MVADLRDEVVAQLGREVFRQLGGERLLVGKVAGQHLFFERQLDVGHQGGQFRRGQSDTDLLAPGNLLFGRQGLEFAVETAALLEFPDLAGVHVQQRRRVGTTGAHQIVLVAVVSQHQPGHLIGHRGQ